MKPYPKIQSVYKRESEKPFKMLEGQFSTPELEYLANNVWVWTEKVDGTNIRVHWDGEKVVLGGKSDNAQIPPFLLAKLQEMFPTSLLQEAFGETIVTLYGEGYGAKIQKGGGNYLSNSVSFVLFDVLIDGWWLRRDSMLDVAEKLSVNVVPVVGNGTLYEMVEVAKAGFRSVWGDFPAEGLVGKPLIELQDRQGRRILTKIKYKDFQ